MNARFGRAPLIRTSTWESLSRNERTAEFEPEEAREHLVKLSTATELEFESAV